MINVYKTNDNMELMELELNENNLIPTETWIKIINPNSYEIDKISELTKLPKDILQSALDLEERPRIEIKQDFLMIVINVPVVTMNNSYDTIPLGIIITKEYFVTVSISTSNILDTFINNKVAFATENKMDFMLQIMLRASSLFLKYLQQIINSLDQIESTLQRSTRNAEIFKVMILQKSLNFFNSSLYANDAVIEKLLKFNGAINYQNIVSILDKEKELLEDIIIENKQAIAMGEMYSRILSDMMGCFASIISNNQSIIIKSLTIVTILLSIPVIFAGFWGMNVEIPFKDTSIGFWIVVSVSFFIPIGILGTFWKKIFFK
jgi:magnesium transporter